MGKIVLVPAAVQFETVVPATGGRFSGTQRIYPVMLHSDNGNNLRAEVMIQEPTQAFFREDPFPRFSSFFNIGRMRVGRRTKPQAGALGWDMRAEDIAHAFWDHDELVGLIADFAGDVYLQIEDDKWKFQSTHPDDTSRIPQVLSRRKKHRFQASIRSKYDEITPWLYENTKGDFDMDTNTGAIYIREEAEAAHFKLRWEGEGAGAGVIGPIGS